MRLSRNAHTGALALALVAAAAAISFTLTTSPMAAAGVTADAGSWKADPVHSTCVFRIRHAGATNFYGMFRGISGGFTLDEETPANSSFNITIKTTQIDTGNAKRDKDVSGPDFFNVRQFPEATFVSTSVESAGDGAYKVKGNFALHGVTKEVTAMVRKVAEGSFRGTKRLGVEAVLQIKRADFGMTAFLASDGGDAGPLGNSVVIIVSLEGMPA